MEFVSPLFDLYTDYLIVNPAQTTATGLASLLEGSVKHDSITRFFSYFKAFDSLQAFGIGHQ